MKLNLNFANKTPKDAQDSEIIFLRQKSMKRKDLEYLSKSVFSNKLFLEQKFIIKNQKDKYFVFVNCTNNKISLDFESKGLQWCSKIVAKEQRLWITLQ